MKKQLFIAITLILQLSTYAQLDSFDLKMYKLPILSHHELTVNGGINSSSEKGYSIDYVNRDNHSMNINAAYRYYRNSPKWQFDGTLKYNISSNLNMSYYTDERSSRISNNYNYSLDLVSKTYVRPKLFWGIDLGFNQYTNVYNSNSLNKTTNNKNESRTHIDNRNFYLAPSIGYGRINQIQDANLAVYI